MFLKTTTPLTPELLEATAQLSDPDHDRRAETRFTAAVAPYDGSVDYYLRTLAREVRGALLTLPGAQPAQKSTTELSTVFRLRDVGHGGMYITYADGRALRMGFYLRGAPYPHLVLQCDSPVWEITAPLRAALADHLGSELTGPGTPTPVAAS